MTTPATLRAAVAALCLTALTACGQLPRPFQAEDKAANELLHLSDRAGILVMPMAGDRPGAPGTLAEAMVARLRDLNVPASATRGNEESPVLYGRALVRPISADGEEALLFWELRDVDGRRRGMHSLRRELPKGSWWRADPELIAALAAAAAPKVAAMVQDPAVEMAAIPGFPRARLVVLPLDGAPGDSADSLIRALEAELLAAKLPVAERIAEDDLLVLGDVALGPARDGRQDVAVTWLVVSAREGTDLGEVAQRNRVPAGSLDGPWGPTARAIARGAAEGVMDLLKRASKP